MPEKKPELKHRHGGHRDRMRRRFEKTGFDHFQKHEMLEMLLYYCIPQRDTNEIAHELLDHFGGSVKAVFEASIEELTEVKYISYNTAILIKMIPALAGVYIDESTSPGECIKCSKDAKDYFKGKFFGCQSERVLIAFLDNSSRVISCDVLAEGIVNSARIDMHKILTGAVLKRASFCILAHNHPHGTPIPSVEDANSTRRVKKMLDEVGVHLKDHIVVGEGEQAVSMSESYKYRDVFPD